MKKTKETQQRKGFIAKAKKLRSVVMMVLLCVLMMSAATYAWFTLSNTAKVSNLTMTVGDVTGLQVAEYKQGKTETNQLQDVDWKQEISVAEFKGKLLPATTTDGINFLAPVYGEDGSVINTSTTSEKLDGDAEESSEGYYVEYTFWMRAMGSAGTTTVQLDPGQDLNNGIYETTGTATGTYSLSKNIGADDILPSAAVRISIAEENNNSVKVFEPNVDYDKAAQKKAIDSRSSTTVKAPDVTQGISGGFISDNSNVLTLTNNAPTKIKLRIWLEGTDNQCGNEIAAKDIVTQLKFSTVKDSQSGN